METTEGEIQNIKKNGLGLQINGDWYSSFKVLPNNFKKGDFVKLGFEVNKGFKNIKSLDKIKSDIPGDKVVQGYEFKEPLKPKISDQVIDTILMQSVEYAKLKGINLKESTEKVVESYKFIIANI